MSISGMTIEKAGDFGAPIFKNLGFGTSLIEAIYIAMHDPRSILWDDKIVWNAKLTCGSKTIFPRNEGSLHVHTSMEGRWNVYYGKKFWGRVTFIVSGNN